MNMLVMPVGYPAARETLARLERDVVFAYDNASHTIPEIHRGARYKSAAVRFARKTGQLETAFKGQVYAAAAEITAVSCKGWDKNPEIVGLWHRLAEVVAHFSAHPTKKVSTLIVSEDGVLQAFAANRVPEGIPWHGTHYVQKKRKNYIVCSERLALVRLLGLRAWSSDLDKLPKHDRRILIPFIVSKLTRDVIEIGRNSDILKKSFILTKVSPCESCAHAVVPFQPRGIIVGGHGEHFTRAAGIERAKKILAHIPVSDNFAPQFR